MTNKGFKRRDIEPFAMIPESAMCSEALMTAPHAALRVLVILLMGKAKERNGTLMCTDTYAAKFGMKSRDTVYRSLHTLEERGLTVCTRKGMKLRKVSTLWAVTWWPIYYQDGQQLAYPRPATNAYLLWTPTAKLHTDSRCNVTPVVGVEGTPLHTDLTPTSTLLHTDGREYSKSLGGGLRERASLPTSGTPYKSPPLARGPNSKCSVRFRKAGQRLAADPNADIEALVRMYRLTDAEAQQLESLRQQRLTLSES